VLVLYAALHVSPGHQLKASLPGGFEDKCISSPWDCEADDVDFFEDLKFMSTTTQEVHPTNIKCSDLKSPDVGAIKAAMSTGPVTTQKPSVSTPTYLFVLAAPHTSSTGLFSLLATSPDTSTLCSAHTWACEGTWLLIERGMMTGNSRWDQDLPRDWNAAVDAYAEFWNSSQQVFLEKSPPNIAKAERIYSQLTKSGKRVKFLILTRSPCYKGSWRSHYPEPPLAKQMRFMMDASANLPRSSYFSC